MPVLLAPQQRALVTYIKRVYYPFMVREPELCSVGNHLCALWMHSSPSSHSASCVVLGLAVVIPALENLPAALLAVEELIATSGAESSSSQSQLALIFQLTVKKQQQRQSVELSYLGAHVLVQ